MPSVYNKRGTRAQLDSAAGSSGLNAGELYLITDENLLAIGLSSSTYEVYAKAQYHLQVALSASGADIEAGTKKAVARVPVAGTLTGFVIDCDPANEPSAAAVQVDLNTVDRTTGTATSQLSAVAQINTGANTGTGTVSGTPSLSAGDILSFDVDQGSDGKELIGTVEITP